MKTFAIKPAKVTGIKLTAKSKGFKVKWTYYVQVRAYTTVNGKKYYSAWSTAKKIKTLK